MFVQNGNSPQVVVFDLDYTLWHMWIDCHLSGPPFQSINNGKKVADCNGNPIALYDDVSSILHTIKREFPDTHLAIASRTSEPEWAMEILEKLIIVDPLNPSKSTRLKDMNLQTDKQKHFKAIHKKLENISYTSMLFFDDEERNIRSVSKLGVSCCLVTNRLDMATFKRGIDLYNANQYNFSLKKTARDGVCVNNTPNLLFKVTRCLENLSSGENRAVNKIIHRYYPITDMECIR
ncbi:Magnesium-dependent phosphatase 1 [Nowakowskiella sp. JEL0078]|nr:Magnesium-dependent phosphatase 1 [Nowakowskiella sp. JEL0078]